MPSSRPSSIAGMTRSMYCGCFRFQVFSALVAMSRSKAMYELEDHNVLRSAAYLDTVKYQQSPQRAKFGTSKVGPNFLRNAYRQIFPVHTHPIEQTVGNGSVSANGAD